MVTVGTIRDTHVTKATRVPVQLVSSLGSHTGTTTETEQNIQITGGMTGMAPTSHCAYQVISH